jgi:dihydroneopterin aldolase / 2-amino-4-hydroxy-6-hydroxymethyldihydropteridine diphosphokinase
MPTKRSSKPPPPPSHRPTGRLILTGLTAFGYHGHNPAERQLGQVFTADLEVTLDTRKAASSDRLEDTISYPILEKTARQILEGKPANLLETVAERIATAILKYPEVSQVTVRVAKRPPLPNLSAFSVEITRPAD